MPLPPTAEVWWGLFNLYTTLAVIIGSLVIGFMIYFLIKYKYRPEAPEPSDAPKPGTFPKERSDAKLFIIFFILVSGVLFTLALGTLQARDFIENPSPVLDKDEPLIINVVAFQWGWKFIYPNGTETINEVRVPVGKIIVFNVTSNDVFHKFGIPYFKVAIDAIPGKANMIWIRPISEGVYTIQCYELCGVGHALMKGKIIVEG